MLRTAHLAGAAAMWDAADCHALPVACRRIAGSVPRTTITQ
jgi:hypothetical protein